MLYLVRGQVRIVLGEVLEGIEDLNVFIEDALNKDSKKTDLQQLQNVYTQPISL